MEIVLSGTGIRQFIGPSVTLDPPAAKLLLLLASRAAESSKTAPSLDQQSHPPFVIALLFTLLLMLPLSSSANLPQRRVIVIAISKPSHADLSALHRRADVPGGRLSSRQSASQMLHPLPAL